MAQAAADRRGGAVPDNSVYVAFLFDTEQTAQQPSKQLRTLNNDNFHEEAPFNFLAAKRLSAPELPQQIPG